MNKLEIAKSIKEPSEKHHVRGRPQTKYFYAAHIDGVRFCRSSVWWAMWHEKISGETFGRTVVGDRASRWESEEAACLAVKWESEKDCIERLGIEVERFSKPKFSLDVVESVTRTFFSKRLV